MIDKKLLDRIQKLLALAESCNPNEARIARLRADKLLAQLNLSEDEALGLGAYTILPYTTKDQSSAPWKIQMYSGVASVLGCSILYRRRSRTIEIVGRTGRAEIVRYIFSVVERNMVEAWKTFRKNQNRSLTSKDRQAWFKFFSQGVQEKVWQIFGNLSTDERDSLHQEVKDSRSSVNFDVKVVSSKGLQLDWEAEESLIVDAYDAGVNQNLNIGVGTSTITTLET